MSNIEYCIMCTSYPDLATLSAPFLCQPYMTFVYLSPLFLCSVMGYQCCRCACVCIYMYVFFYTTVLFESVPFTESQEHAYPYVFVVA